MRTDRKKRRPVVYRLSAWVLLPALLCGGCGNSADNDIPELVEPVSVNAAYRPVEYRDIGKTEVLLGTAVPKEYCHYYDANVSISEITVEVGDTVAAGDILAYADVEEARDALEDMRAQLAMENAMFELNGRISQARCDSLAYQKEHMAESGGMTGDGVAPDGQPPQEQPPEGTTPDAAVPDGGQPEGTEGSQDAGSSDGVLVGAAFDGGGMTEADYDTQIATEQENARYDAMLHEYRVRKLQEEIASLQEVIADGTLVARHGGRVTYTKNIAKGREAGVNENIVVVSDLDDIGIEITDTNVQKYKYADYEVKYIVIAGEKIPVTEEAYSTDEMVLAKVNDRFPNVRILCPESVPLSIGDMYPVYYVEHKIEHVLVVGNDSLYREGDEYYVYLAGEDGEQEKRVIEIGAVDENYTQVKEGLAEGEMVYYQSTAKMPSDYAEHTVELSDFNIENHGIQYGKSDANIFPCLSSYKGRVVEMAVHKDQPVEKGDLLYVVDTGEGKAAMTAAKNAIDQENSAYQHTMASYDEQIAAAGEAAAYDGSAVYEIQILEAQKEIETLNHSYNAKQLQESYDRISQGNDGSGRVSVYAPLSGTVSRVELSEGDAAEPGDQILQITTQSTDILLVQMKSSQNITVYSDNIADIGERISLRTGDKSYEGTCIGWAAGSNNLGKGYVYTDEKGAHLSYNASSGYDYPAFYVKMDDTSLFEEGAKGGSVDFDYISMQDVVVLPTSMIYGEMDPLNENNITYHVWRVVNGELVKQYVLVSDTLKSPAGQVVLSGIEPGDVLAQW